MPMPNLSLDGSHLRLLDGQAQPHGRWKNAGILTVYVEVLADSERVLLVRHSNKATTREVYEVVGATIT